MGSDTDKPAPSSLLLSLKHGEDIELWTRRLACSEFELRKATAAVGTSLEAVRLYLINRK